MHYLTVYLDKKTFRWEQEGDEDLKSLPSDPRNLQEMLAMVGGKGWELVTVTTDAEWGDQVYIFKRP